MMQIVRSLLKRIKKRILSKTIKTILRRATRTPVPAKKNASLNYSVDKIIGNGTFGVVYLATMTDTGEKVAIKKVFQDKR